MYAVIKTGGNQYRVAEGDVLRVEKLPESAGELVSFGQVLMLEDAKKTTVGTPNISGAEVKATVLEQTHADKVVIFKKRRRQNSRRKNGHRQPQTVVRVTEISAGKPVSANKPRPKKASATKKQEQLSDTSVQRNLESKE